MRQVTAEEYFEFQSQHPEYRSGVATICEPPVFYLEDSDHKIVAKVVDLRSYGKESEYWIP